MTSAVDVLLAAARALSIDERERLLAGLGTMVEREQAGELGETEQLLDGLRLAAEHLGAAPSPDGYDIARRELREHGIELPPRSQLMRRFDSWRGAKEALGLYLAPSKTTTPRRIEARFASRRLGKVWRYTEEALGEAMRDAVAYWGRPPRVAEFDHWRERELELAKARGDESYHLPSASPYRGRWGSWDGALLALGYAPEWIAKRLDPTRDAVRRNRNASKTDE
jgi:Homing endonuclease associated repeat